MSTTERRAFYPYTAAQGLTLARHPRVSGTWLADKRLWDGREVAAVVINRGNHRRRTDRRVYYGTLVLAAGDADQFGVRAADGEVTAVHVSRAVDVYDLSRTAR